MKKILIAVVAMLACGVQLSFATSGTCSYHGGVDCSAGEDTDGSVICNDGWTESSVLYSDMSSCGSDAWTRLMMYPIDPMTKACSNVPNYLNFFLNKTEEHKKYKGVGYAANVDCMDKNPDKTGLNLIAFCGAEATTNDQKQAEKLATEETITMCTAYTNGLTFNSNDGQYHCGIGYTGSTKTVKCITLTDSCKEMYGLNAQQVGVEKADETFSCGCSSGYIFNTDKTACVSKADPTNTKTIDINTENHDFTDVPPLYKYAAAINYLKQNHVINGYSQGTFKPDSFINRAEFTKILVNAVYPNQAITPRDCFTDVKASDWFSQYVCFAKDKGIIEGHPDGSYRPQKNINVAEALKISIEAFFPNLVDKMTRTNGITSLSDDWWMKYMEFANQFGYNLTDWDSPSHYVSRGEMAEVIFRLDVFVPPNKQSPTAFHDL